ncbi:hypothetical protein BU16DRAFT_556095 [Lophium mytilinum]|uniref:Uncharacterized protein n=1 Tax=Lophium mytilinum TaxID=390894 RepID=A0A6A6R9X2_9PEZI|nr:hypothetical protein BU16DRAFT_556095 [Lophium mytilinum]
MHTDPSQPPASPRSNPISHLPIPPPPYTKPNDRRNSPIILTLTILLHLLAITLTLTTFISGTAITPGTTQRSHQRALGDPVSILRFSIELSGWNTTDGQEPPYNSSLLNPYAYLTLGA